MPAKPRRCVDVGVWFSGACPRPLQSLRICCPAPRKRSDQGAVQQLLEPMRVSSVPVVRLLSVLEIIASTGVFASVSVM